MNFDTPLRVTWNVTAHAVPDRVFTRVARELASARVMEITLRIRPGQLVRQAVPLAALAEGSRLDLVLPGESVAPGGLRKLVARLQAAGIALSSLSLDWTARLPRGVTSSADLPLLAVAVREVGGKVRLALTLVPEAATLAAALELTRRAPGLGFAEVRLTHPDLVGRSADAVPPGVLTPDLLRRVGGPFPGEPLIHDFFLKEALLGRAVGSGSGGCQAANAMAHLDAAGRVYPCSALPIPLGDLKVEGLAAIWRSAFREELRRQILRLGPVCVGCGRQDQCHGGCRGLAYFLTGDWSSPDPACPGPV